MATPFIGPLLSLGVGASLTYGNLQLDGTLSNNGELGATDDVLTNVSMTYVF